MSLVLLIEDSIEVAQLVIRSLEATVTVARTLSEARMALMFQVFNLIILDYNLPDGDGFEFFKTLDSKIPVIMLTSVSDHDAIAKALDAGVEDYVVKPFNRTELSARVNRRMSRPQPLASTMVTLGSLTICKDTQRATVGNETIDLTSIEFRILNVLAARPNEAIDREVIFKTVWPNEESNMRAIDTHVSKLRKKLGSDKIESVHGVGYRLTA